MNNIVVVVCSEIMSTTGNNKIIALTALLSALFSVMVMIFIFSIIEKKRKKEMQKLINEIDSILAGEENIRLSDYKESDLSILRNEVQKMTIMLRNQRDMLAKEKVNLADFLADISHQIRTPLTSLNLLVAAIRKSDIDEEKRMETAFDMNKQLQRIDWLVGTLLKMAKIDAGTVKLTPTENSMEEVVGEVTDSLDIMLDVKGVTLKKNLEGSARIDKPWTQEALLNIIKNCIEHTQEGGIITVDTRENAIFTEVIITDNGEGMDLEDAKHIFERFYKGKNSSSQSYGIGLALARMIISSQNGSVKAENRTDGKGVAFTVRFYKNTAV